MFVEIVKYISDLQSNINERYGVSSVFFLVLYLSTWPIFYITLGWMILGVIKKETTGRILLKGIVTFFVWFIPYGYLLLFGRGYSKKSYLFFAAFLVISLIIIFMKTQKRVKEKKHVN